MPITLRYIAIPYQTTNFRLANIAENKDDLEPNCQFSNIMFPQNLATIEMLLHYSPNNAALDVLPRGIKRVDGIVCKHTCVLMVYSVIIEAACLLVFVDTAFAHGEISRT